MARLSLSKQRETLASLAELLAYGVALTYGAAVWLQGLHYFSGIPQDWGYALSEATVKLPLVIMAVWVIRAALRAFIGRRGSAMPRLAVAAVVALGMAIGAFGAIVLDGVTTELFYPELALTASNPFLCTVLGVGASGAIPGLGTAYDALVTLPALLAIAVALAALRPLTPARRPAAA